MRTCRYCYSSVDDVCDQCQTEHDKARRVHPVGSYGRKMPSITLDQVEGNAEEYFGGLDFPVKGWRA